MTRRALGRGLNALLAESPTTSIEELTEIDIDLIEPNSAQPRTFFDENKLEELAQSIRANGIVQPLLVRRRGGRYQLVAGERRWRAAQLAGLQRVPAVVKDIPDDKMLELALIENIQRHELNPIEEAHAYKRLIETLNLTQETVAQRVGRDRTFVTNHLRLLKLPVDLQNLVEQEKLSMGHARALVGVNDTDTQRKIAQNIVEQGLSVRNTEKLIKKAASNTVANMPIARISSAENPNVRAAEVKLRRRLGTQVRVLPNQTGTGGIIEIEYYSESDLNRFYKILVATDDEGSLH